MWSCHFLAQSNFIWTLSAEKLWSSSENADLWKEWIGKGKVFNQVEFKKLKGNGNWALHDNFYQKQISKWSWNINIEQAELNFDWFTHHCVLTKRFDWLKQKKTHVLSLKSYWGRIVNIREFWNTLIRVSCAAETQRT